MSVDFYKIRDHSGLIKNADTNAILNVDGASLNKYRDERQRMIKLSQVVENNQRLEKEVAEVKNALSEILELLRNKA